MHTSIAEQEAIADFQQPLVQPTLLISNTSNFVKIVNDQGSHASDDVTIWRPTPSLEGFFILGDHAEPNYNDAPTGTAYIVKAVNDDPNAPLLVPPASFNLVWEHNDGSGDTQMTLWQPVPPDGYIAMGCVTYLRNDGTPTAANFPTYRCVRLDLVEETTVGGEIWNDHGTKSSFDGSIWKIDKLPNAFLAVRSYDPPNYAHKLKAKSALRP